MILFGFTALLEHSGAMARLGYVGDRFLRKLGLGGRSTVSLVGGMACAVPAVMATRALPDRRERLLTILVTPMMTCSARLPVYAFLIAFVVPDGTVWGMNHQGLFLYGLYLASTAATLVMAWLLNRALPKDRQRIEHAEEWPAYRMPKVSLVASNMVRQGAVFLRSAGQVILILSVVLWGLGFVGSGSFEERQSMAPAERLETSVLGAVGNAIEPVVTPLGYDGRLGIAVLSSFAAREVFVGTVQTLYPSPDGSTPKVSELKARLGLGTGRGPHGPRLHPGVAHPRPSFLTQSLALLGAWLGRTVLALSHAHPQLRRRLLAHRQRSAACANGHGASRRRHVTHLDL
jgi:ferrous iron transport protein B